jgi:hypothetical protein
MSHMTPVRLTGKAEIIAGQNVGFWEVLEIDNEECLKADKSQGRFRHIIDF